MPPDLYRRKSPGFLRQLTGAKEVDDMESIRAIAPVDGLSAYTAPPLSWTQMSDEAARRAAARKARLSAAAREAAAPRAGASAAVRAADAATPAAVRAADAGVRKADLPGPPPRGAPV